MANIDLKIDTLIAEIRNIKLMAIKTMDEEIEKTESNFESLSLTDRS